MKCMYAQTRPRFILSSEGVFGGMEFEPMLTPREKSPLPKMSPEEDRTRDAVDSEPKHYQLSYSSPLMFHSRPVHSLMLSSHRFLCLPLRPPPRRVTKMEDIGCGLAWRGMGSAMRHCPRHTTCYVIILVIYSVCFDTLSPSLSLSVSAFVCLSVSSPPPFLSD